MRLQSVTPERLILEERPWFLGSLLIVVIVALLALALLFVPVNGWAALGFAVGATLFGAVFVFVVRRTVVIFDRIAGAVEIRAASLTGMSQRRIALNQILAAEAETVTSAASPGPGQRTTVTRRPVLQTRDGIVVLSPIYSGGPGALQVADIVNDWLAQRDP